MGKVYWIKCWCFNLSCFPCVVGLVQFCSSMSYIRHISPRKLSNARTLVHSEEKYILHQWDWASRTMREHSEADKGEKEGWKKKKRRMRKTTRIVHAVCDWILLAVATSAQEHAIATTVWSLAFAISSHPPWSIVRCAWNWKWKYTP